MDRYQSGRTQSGRTEKLFLAMLVLGLSAGPLCSHGSVSETPLPRKNFRSGEEMLRVLQPISAATRHSIVKLNIEGRTVALATVIDHRGLAITKASEIKKGKLTCWLADDREVEAELLSVEEEDDVALIRVHGEGLKPIQWAEGEPTIGAWAVTPGIAETPHAVGIISALPHRIRPPRAFIGVRFDSSEIPKIERIISGLGAEKAGLKSGDVISDINNIAITNRIQVVDMLREFKDGDTVRIRIKRAEEIIEKEVRMSASGSELTTRDFFPTQRMRRLSGDLSERAEGFEKVIEHDTVLQPWLCGGPLVNLDGQAIGLNIARAGRVTSYALPPALVNRLVEKLKARAAETRTQAQDTR